MNNEGGAAYFLSHAYNQLIQEKSTGNTTAKTASASTGYSSVKKKQPASKVAKRHY